MRRCPFSQRCPFVVLSGLALAAVLGSPGVLMAQALKDVNKFPARDKNAAIIAEHESWNRSTPSGYRVMAAFTDGRKVTGYEPFLDGFLPGTASTPVTGHLCRNAR